MSATDTFMIALGVPACYVILYAAVRIAAAAYFKSKQQFGPTTKGSRHG